MRKRTFSLCQIAALIVASTAPSLRLQAQDAHTRLPSFEAISLTGKHIDRSALLGSPTVLIVTPSRDASKDTREWAERLRKDLGNRVPVRDILALDLPFFISDDFAMSKAKDEIPRQFWDRTWFLKRHHLKSQLGIPESSDDAVVLVLDSEANVLARVQGAPTGAKLRELERALSK